MNVRRFHVFGILFVLMLFTSLNCMQPVPSSWDGADDLFSYLPPETRTLAEDGYCVRIFQNDKGSQAVVLTRNANDPVYHLEPTLDGWQYVQKNIPPSALGSEIPAQDLVQQYPPSLENKRPQLEITTPSTAGQPFQCQPYTPSLGAGIRASSSGRPIVHMTGTGNKFNDLKGIVKATQSVIDLFRGKNKKRRKQEQQALQQQELERQEREAQEKKLAEEAERRHQQEEKRRLEEIAAQKMQELYEQEQRELEAQEQERLNKEKERLEVAKKRAREVELQLSKKHHEQVIEAQAAREKKLLDKEKIKPLHSPIGRQKVQKQKSSHKKKSFKKNRQLPKKNQKSPKVISCPSNDRYFQFLQAEEREESADSENNSKRA